MDGRTVRVCLYGAARASVGATEVHAPAGTVSSILDTIQGEHPAFAAVRPRCSVLVDGLVVHDHATEVAPGSLVDVLPPFAGGWA